LQRVPEWFGTLQSECTGLQVDFRRLARKNTLQLGEIGLQPLRRARNLTQLGKTGPEHLGRFSPPNAGSGRLCFKPLPSASKATLMLSNAHQHLASASKATLPPSNCSLPLLRSLKATFPLCNAFPPLPRASKATLTLC